MKPVFVFILFSAGSLAGFAAGGEGMPAAAPAKTPLMSQMERFAAEEKASPVPEPVKSSKPSKPPAVLPIDWCEENSMAEFD